MPAKVAAKGRGTMARWETGGGFMRFTIRDLLWLTVVVAVLCLLVIQRSQFRGHVAALNEQIDELKVQASQPRSVTIGYEDEREIPAGMRRAIVDFPPDGSVKVRYEPIPPEQKSN